ncbi:hypothetical protein DC498_23830 [Terrimonas sp.]|uniref:M56 family metallopeptidase n=1 Tax=Terrimonas sp. TaxID=1914338 RepID=UPI000D512CB6|nr:M56 family metallopeptidase [Terrimonas sp.]PVD49641.1 hypothetical protein DC498_23830 [Terrimonas sp.]
MQIIADYIIKLSVSFAIVFLFYRVALSNLTFYKWNRIYLLAYTSLCFFIPFVNIMPVIRKSGAERITMLNMIPALQTTNAPVFTGENKTAATVGWPVMQAVIVGIAAVSIVLLTRMIIQLISLKKAIRYAQLIADKEVKLYHIDKDIIPFSFGNAIFINTNLHQADELKEIICHEFVHVKQKHSIDILWAELLCIFNWFNPFVWLLRHAIRQNLEFIADNKVVESGMDKTQYQYLLLKVLGNNHFAVASSFNFSSLKKRVFMMNKIKTTKVHLLKFLFILPLMVILLLAFRSKQGGTTRSGFFTIAGIVVDNETLQPIEDVIIGDVFSGTQAASDKKGYYALKIPVINKDTLQVRFSYQKEGYPGNTKMAALQTSNPVTESNDIIIIGINKNNSNTYIHGYGSAKRNSQIVNPDYDLVYAKYIDFIDDKKTEAQIGNSPKPVHIINGIPYAVGNGSMAWFDQEEVNNSSECKVWADGKIMSIDEANKTINRYELNGVAAVPRKEAKEKFGIDCNILVLMKDSLNPIQHNPPKKEEKKPGISTAYFITPSLVLDGKTTTLKASGPFSGRFIGNNNDTLKAMSASGGVYELNNTDIVTLNGTKMETNKLYSISPLYQFKIISSANFKNNGSRNIEITTVPL